SSWTSARRRSSRICAPGGAVLVCASIGTCGDWAGADFAVAGTGKGSSRTALRFAAGSSCGAWAGACHEGTTTRPNVAAMVSNKAPPDWRQGLCISKPSCFWGDRSEPRGQGSGAAGPDAPGEGGGGGGGGGGTTSCGAAGPDAPGEGGGDGSGRRRAMSSAKL